MKTVEQGSQHPRKQAYHHGDLKRALLDETARILREEGEDALSLRRLASKLGVSRTAPYNHFANKESLLCAVAVEGFERFNVAMRVARDRSRGLDGRAATHAIVKAYVQFASENQEYYDLMYGSRSWRAVGPSNPLASAARGTLRADVERLKRGQERGLICAEIDALRFARVYWGTLHGISRLILDGVYADSVSVARVCEEAADTIWARLSPE